MNLRSSTRNPLIIAALFVGAPLLAGCNGAIIGNLVVLGVTVGIFFGTLSLGRSSETARSADASTSTAGRS